MSEPMSEERFAELRAVQRARGPGIAWASLVDFRAWLGEALDEIERLRADVELREHVRQQQARIIAEEQERTRSALAKAAPPSGAAAPALVEALRACVEEMSGCERCGMDAEFESESPALINARAALSGAGAADAPDYRAEAMAWRAFVDELNLSRKTGLRVETKRIRAANEAAERTSTAETRPPA